MAQNQKTPVIIVHGGAGAAEMIKIDPAFEEGKRAGVLAAIRAGCQVLSAPGGSALDAVQRVMEVFEEEPFSNAGIGSVLTRTGRIQMDASLMDGRDLRVGAVTCIEQVLHPIRAARLVMEQTDTLILSGDGATSFAHSHGVEKVCQESLQTRAMEVALKNFQDKMQEPQFEHDTVGAVAMDTEGNFAYASTSGGRTGKLDGRVGDSAIPGHSGYADNDLGAVTCTGTGETFIKTNLGFRIATQLGSGKHVEDVCRDSLTEAINRVGGSGGVIAVDKAGQIGIHYSTAAMAWAYVTGSEHIVHHGLYKGEHLTEQL